MNAQLTIHIINEIPWSNLNRDDTGMPKRLRQGGKQRGLLSSQSIKRGARTDYELKSLDLSVRSANLAAVVAERAQKINGELDSKKAEKLAKKLIGALTKGESKAADSEEGSSKQSAWLSAEEIETAANAVAQELEEADFIQAGRTGSLAIAGFGRMFAQKPELQTEAAIAVSPAVSTHESVIETDYFSTVDDSPVNKWSRAASYLGIAHYINGVFYRSVTIDKDQLKESWTGFDGPDAADKLEQFVTSLIYGMPRGKEKSTSPYTVPALVLIETQAYRVAYDFETPVLPQSEGGFLDATLRRLNEQRDAALHFDPENFGQPMAVAGTGPDLERFGVEVLNRPEIARKVVDWILQ